MIHGVLDTFICFSFIFDDLIQKKWKEKKESVLCVIFVIRLLL